MAIMYWALSLTHGWDAATILQTIGAFFAYIVHLILLKSATAHPGVMAGELVVLLALAWLLRWHAQQRWLALDWRIASPQPLVRTG